MKKFYTLALLLLCLVLGLAPLATAQAQKGSYQLVGLGPAGLDLTTPRALKAIQEADIVFTSSKTRKMLKPKIDFRGKQVIEGFGLVFPYYGKKCPKGSKAQKKRWGKTCDEFHQKQAEFAAKVRSAVAQGKKVVMTTSGDPTIYGPAIWTVLELKDIDAKVVPGLSAFNAGNAAQKCGLGEVVITAPFTKKGGKDGLKALVGYDRGTMAIFMPRKMEKLWKRLAEIYPKDMPVSVVANAGYPEKQTVLLGTIGNIKDKLKGKDVRRSLVYVGRTLARAQYASPQLKSKGKFYLVGVGPGDADLATLRALKVIREADVIFAHKRIQEIFKEELKGKKVISGYHRLFPFYGRPCPKKGEKKPRREHMTCEQYHQKQAELGAMVRLAVAQGKKVALLDSGDPMVYGPCNWTLTEFRDIPTEVVPGISCFNAANAALAAAVTEGTQTHSVMLASGWSVEEMARHQATMVLFTMRTNLKKFTNAIKKHYPDDTPAALVFHAGYAAKERVLRGTVGDILQKAGDKRLPFQHMLYVGDALTNIKPY
jgi:precorrin-4 methylase